MISDCLRESLAISTLIVIKNSVSMQESNTLQAYGLTLQEAKELVGIAIETLKSGGKITQCSCERLQQIFIC